jgi:hypothetical protein
LHLGVNLWADVTLAYSQKEEWCLASKGTLNMDTYAKFIEIAARDVRDAVVLDTELHPLVGQTLLEAEVLIALLRRLTKMHLESLSVDARSRALTSLPAIPGEYEDRPEQAKAYRAVRAYLIREYTRH